MGEGGKVDGVGEEGGGEDGELEGRFEKGMRISRRGRMGECFRGRGEGDGGWKGQNSNF